LNLFCKRDKFLHVTALKISRRSFFCLSPLPSLPGVRGIYAGRLRNCGQVEALTANLVSVNRRYKAHAGLRVTDI